MSDEESSLRMRTGELSIELTGDPDALRQSYAALRPIITQALRREDEKVAGIANGDSRPSQQAESAGDQTRPMHRVDDGQLDSAHTNTPRPDSGERDFRLCLHREDFRQVYVVDGSKLPASLERAIDPTALAVLHASEQALDALEDILPDAKTLWREIRE